MIYLKLKLALLIVYIESTYLQDRSSLYSRNHLYPLIVKE